MWKDYLSIPYQNYTNKQKGVADYLLAKKDDIEHITIKRCADETGVGEPTIVRTLKLAGFSSWREFQKTVLKEMGVNWENQLSQTIVGKQSNTALKVLNDDMHMISDMAKNLNLEQLKDVVKIIKKAKIIDVYGTDNSANAAAELSGTLLHLGLTSRNYADLFFQKISAGHLGKRDVAIGFSISGETKAVIEALKAAKDCGATTIAVTANLFSSFAVEADYAFYTPTIHHSEASKWISSRICQIAFVDTLCAAIMASDEEKFSEKLEKSTEKFEEDLSR